MSSRTASLSDGGGDMSSRTASVSVGDSSDESQTIFGSVGAWRYPDQLSPFGPSQ
jgi:hypothetical protein